MKLPAPLSRHCDRDDTPLLDRDTLDVTGLERLIANLNGGEVNGLFILGIKRGGKSFHSCRHAAERIPDIVGIRGTS